MSLALWHNSDFTSELKEEKNSKIDIDQIEVKSLFSLISTGTERLVASGEVPVSSFEFMAVPYMKGNFSFPIKYGYSLVGKVTSVGKLYGKIVHLLHPHQGKCLVKEVDVMIVPDEIPAKRATLASNVETALNAIWDAEISIGDKVLIAGFGMIGSLLARVLSFMPEVEIVIMEKDANRVKMVQKMGFTFIDDPEPSYFDVAFNTTSNEKALQIAIQSVGLEGKIIEMSWYGTKNVNINLGADFHYHRKQIISSQVSKIPSDKQSRWDYKRRKEVVFKLLKSPLFDEHITDVLTFAETPAFFDKLRAGGVSGLGYCIEY